MIENLLQVYRGEDINSVEEVDTSGLYFETNANKTNTNLYSAPTDAKLVEVGRIVKGATDGSLVQAGAVGTRAGIYGYYYTEITVNSSTVTLVLSVEPYNSAQATSTDFTIGYEEGDEICINTCAQTHYNCAKITEIQGNTIVCQLAEGFNFDTRTDVYEIVANKVTKTNYNVFCITNANKRSCGVPVTEGSVAIGQYARSYGNNSFVIGYDCTSLGNRSTALGSGCISTGSGSFAAGSASRALNNSAIAIGYQSKANAFGSIALGYMCEANSKYGAAIGWRCIAKHNKYNTAQIVVGQNNAESLDSIFVVGVGSTPSTPKNALTVSTSGQLDVLGNTVIHGTTQLKENVQIDKELVSKDKSTFEGPVQVVNNIAAFDKGIKLGDTSFGTTAPERHLEVGEVYFVYDDTPVISGTWKWKTNSSALETSIAAYCGGKNSVSVMINFSSNGTEYIGMEFELLTDITAKNIYNVYYLRKGHTSNSPSLQKAIAENSVYTEYSNLDFGWDIKSVDDDFEELIMNAMCKQEYKLISGTYTWDTKTSKVYHSYWDATLLTSNEGEQKKYHLIETNFTSNNVKFNAIRYNSYSGIIEYRKENDSSYIHVITVPIGGNDTLSVKLYEYLTVVFEGSYVLDSAYTAIIESMSKG